MKNIKKILCLALALITLLSVVPMSASALSYKEVEAFSYNWLPERSAWEVDGVRSQYVNQIGSGIYKIPDFHDGYPVIGIAADAFADSKVSSLILSNNTQYISDYAFYHSKLRNIYLPKTLVSIGPNAFFAATYLMNVRYQGTRDEWKKLTKNQSSTGWLLNAGFICGYPDDCYHIDTDRYDRVEPTCTVPGREEGVFCNDCQRATSGFEVIPCIPHYANQTYWIKKPTCYEEGELEMRCKRDENCTYSERRTTVPPLGHNFARRDPVCRRGCGFVCKCRCHKEDFLWKIIQFFYKLFKIKEHCECGYYRTHWEA